MVEIQDRQDFEKWLREQPKQVSVAIAARAALRVLPFTSSAFTQDTSKAAADLVFRTVRAMAVPWFMGAWTYQADEIHEVANKADMAANDAFEASIGEFNAVVYEVARVASDVAASAAISVSVSVGAHAATLDMNANSTIFAVNFLADHKVYWWNISVDATFISEGGGPRGLALLALWEGGTPADILAMWAHLRGQLLYLDQNWWVWIRWYEDRLYGASDR